MERLCEAAENPSTFPELLAEIGRIKVQGCQGYAKAQIPSLYQNNKDNSLKARGMCLEVLF